MKILKLKKCIFSSGISSSFNFSNRLYKDFIFSVCTYKQNQYIPSRLNYFCSLSYNDIQPCILLTQFYPSKIYNSMCITIKVREHNTNKNVIVRNFFSNSRSDSSEKERTNVTEILNHKDETPAKPSQKDKLKTAVRDYGATVIVFHVTISLASLGICYLAISSGMDVASVFSTLGFSEAIINSKIATSGSTFVVSYAVHKLFAPLRIAITLFATPLIVRYLRNIGFLKPPKI